MTSFTPRAASTKSESETVVVLGPSDGAIFPRCIVQYYYQNTTNDPQFMKFETMRDSFRSAIHSCIPMLTGKPTDVTLSDQGTLKIVFDKESPVYPPVTKHIDSEHTVKAMVDANFSLSSQPQVMASSPPVLNPLAGDPLVMLDLVYMPDGVGFCLSFSHAITDYASAVMFVREWAKVAKSMFMDEVVPYQPLELDTDRAKYWTTLEQEPKAEPSPFELHLKHLASEKQGKESAGVTAGAVANALRPSGNLTSQYRIDIPSDALRSLIEVKNDKFPGISINSLLLAIIWRAISAASPDSPYTYFAASLTVRGDKRFANYCGNTATMKYVHEDTRKLLSLDIGSAAQLVQASIRSFTLSEFVHITQLYNSGESYILNLQELVENNLAPRLMAATLSRLPMYNIDFGFGTPAKIVAPPMYPPGFAMLFPSDAAGGMDIYINTSEKAIQLLEADDILKGRITAMKYDV
ncbi:hypothetical protein GGI12_004868 [Dipsacomyces acuminosporus]|nr:hypothetical protein GGI12_004868 [Dipsacomyces acuminosporus]